MKTLDSTAEPAVHAAGPMNRARQLPVNLWKKLAVAAPLPIGAYFLVRAFTVPSAYPGIEMAFTLMRALFFLCATGAFYLSLRALLAIKRARQQM